MNAKYSLTGLVESRLGMQSTQRALKDNFRIGQYSIEYFYSADFRNKISQLSPLQRKNLFILLAGPFNWKAAARMFHAEESLV